MPPTIHWCPTTLPVSCRRRRRVESLRGWPHRGRNLPAHRVGPNDLAQRLKWRKLTSRNKHALSSNMAVASFVSASGLGLVRFCVEGVRRVFHLHALNSCRLSSGHSPAALALHGAPPFRRPGTQFWRQACWKPSNLRAPRPKTATAEPACASSPASSGMPTQLLLANQPPPPACLSRSQETSQSQQPLTVSAGLPLARICYRHHPCPHERKPDEGNKRPGWWSYLASQLGD